MSGSRRASVISSMGADEIADVFEELFDFLNQFKFTEAREYIHKKVKKLPRHVIIVFIPIISSHTIFENTRIGLQTG